MSSSDSPPSAPSSTESTGSIPAPPPRRHPSFGGMGGRGGIRSGFGDRDRLPNFLPGGIPGSGGSMMGPRDLFFTGSDGMDGPPPELIHPPGSRWNPITPTGPLGPGGPSGCDRWTRPESGSGTGGLPVPPDVPLSDTTTEPTTDFSDLDTLGSTENDFETED